MSLQLKIIEKPNIIQIKILKSRNVLKLEWYFCLFIPLNKCEKTKIQEKMGKSESA